MAHNPHPHDVTVLRWSEPPMSTGRRGGDLDEENQQQLVTNMSSKSRVPVLKIDQRGVPRRIDNRPARVRLYQAAQKGDWETAMVMEEEYGSGTLTMVINDRSETALHIATRANRVDFVKKLVDYLGPHDLALKNNYGNTALCIAAASGALGIAKLMVAKYEPLCLIRGSGNATPVLIAATYKHQHMVSFLLSNTPVFGLPLQEQIQLLVGAISADYYDIALLILEWNKLLALERDLNDDTPLHVMARKSSFLQSNTNPWVRVMHIGREKMMGQREARKMVEQLWEVVFKEIPDNEIVKFIMYPTSMLHDAAKVGNVEFLRLVIDYDPDLAWKVDSERRSIFHVAVENRQYKVWCLIYELGGFLDYLPNYFDEGDISLLQLAAKMPLQSHLSRVSGAAFQMHRELIWFKEVEKIVELTMRRKKGNRSPRELFTMEHVRLVDEGEKWMKKTANSCMLVATLITTVVFAAVFTVPGGYNNNNNINTGGSPLFLYQKWFTVFVISDAVALISSSTSILLFLSILTSRCEEEDFLIWLPLKLVFGLATLFFSVVTMVLAFTATFFMFYAKDTAWVPLLVAGMAIVPVYCFGVLQFSLWVDTVEALRATCRLYFGNRNRNRKAI